MKTKCDCNSPVETRKFNDRTTLTYCLNCFEYQSFTHCEHDFKPVLYTYESGAKRVMETCVKCFDRTQSKKLKDYDLGKLPARSAEHYKDYYDEITSERIDFIKYLQVKRDEYFNKKYDDYLTSDKWYVIRNTVMERDNYKCQICKNKATDIHHLTYKNFGKEYLFELVALCRACHMLVYHDNKFQNH